MSNLIKGSSILFFLFFSSLLYSQSWISQTSPLSNQLNVSRSAAITITFNRAMMSSTLTGQNIVVSGAYTGACEKALSYNSTEKKLTITPSSAFKYGEVVTVVVSGAVKDENGVSMSRPHAFSFTCSVNGGRGTFTQVNSAVVVGGSPYKIVSGDYDKDGKIDLAVMDSNKVTILKNDGTGIFTVLQVIGGLSGLADMVTGDINNDGYPDLVCAAQWSNQFAVLKNNGSGWFVHSNNFSTYGTRPMHVSLCNLDNDCYPDVIITNWSSYNFAMFKNDGTGVFSLQNIVAGIGTRPKAIGTGDFDGDGYFDIAIGIDWAPALVETFKNNGNYNFIQVQSVIVPDRPYSITSNDYNNDGKTDLCISNYYDNSVSELTNNGTGYFTSAIYPMGGTGARFLIQGDYDNDGDMDLSIGSAEIGIISVMKNNGTGIFSGNVFINSFGYPGSIANGDFDNDGDLDIAAANTNTGLVSIFKNDNSVGIQPVGTVIPKDFELGQNYPNPFNPSTSFDFSIPKSGYISLKLYDARGTEIRDLFSGYKNAGVYKYTVNASELNLASGVYFYKIIAGEVMLTKKMVLMK